MTSIQKNFGKLDLTIYDLPDVGHEIGIHSHPPGLNHITIVARGSFLMKSGKWEKTVTAGNVIDFQEGEEHGFVALEPNSRLINIAKV